MKIDTEVLKKLAYSHYQLWYFTQRWKRILWSCTSFPNNFSV